MTSTSLDFLFLPWNSSKLQRERDAQDLFAAEHYPHQQRVAQCRECGADMKIVTHRNKARWYCASCNRRFNHPEIHATYLGERKYLHTLDGKPAVYVVGIQIYYASCFDEPRLAENEQQIRKEQRASEEWRKERGYKPRFARLGFCTVRVKSQKNS